MCKNLLGAGEDLRGGAPPLARIMYQSLSPLNRLTLMGILPSPSLIASRSSPSCSSSSSLLFPWNTGGAASLFPPTVMPLGRRGVLRLFLHSLSLCSDASPQGTHRGTKHSPHGKDDNLSTAAPRQTLIHSLEHHNTCSHSSQTSFVPVAAPQVTATAVSPALERRRGWCVLTRRGCVRV